MTRRCPGPCPDPDQGMKAAEWHRVYGPPGRREFVAQLPCVACWRRRCHNHHITSGGIGRKTDYDQIVPLCVLHHGEVHQQNGRHSFAEKYGIDWKEQAALTEKLWKEGAEEE